MSTIYEPAEDSFFMSEVLKRELPKVFNDNPGTTFLEVGCGSGINLEMALFSGIKKSNVFGADINEDAVKHCRELGFNCAHSNLFSNIKEKFDVIAFNPPYLPLDASEPKSSRRETTGGRKGNEIAIKFLKEAKNHLEVNGRIFMITSSLARPINFEDLGYKAEKIAEKNLFFEKLMVWELNLYML